MKSLLLLLLVVFEVIKDIWRNADDMILSSGHQVVRLAGGSDRCEGRVELWRDGQWGTVCDDQWDLQEADMVCAQHSCGYALSVTGQGGPFPPGAGPIHLDELNCTGTEDNLWSCPTAKEESDCGHKEDAGVVCSGYSPEYGQTHGQKNK